MYLDNVKIGGSGPDLHYYNSVRVWHKVDDTLNEMFRYNNYSLSAIFFLFQE